jgi:hypothetical protein
MPAGYIESRKILFHSRVLPHQTCDMNRTQELLSDSQILPRKPSPFRQTVKTPSNQHNESHMKKTRIVTEFLVLSGSTSIDLSTSNLIKRKDLTYAIRQIRRYGNSE